MSDFSLYDDADLESLLSIRLFELKLLELFSAGKLNGTTHTCWGQEYVPVAVTSLLRDDDYVFSNHRGHGHYLARFADPEGLLAEITGRQGAVCNGVGGSQHILRGTYLSTGVQGESIPVATGVGLNLKRSGDGRMVLAYIGDGTWGEGAVYEGLNMASLWGVPLVVVVENNEIAQSTPREYEMCGEIGPRAEALGASFIKINSQDIVMIRETLNEPFAKVRRCEGPLVVEFSATRLGPHSKGDDTRPPELLEKIRGRDWLKGYSAAHPEQVREVEERVSSAIDVLAEAVLNRPLAERE